MTTSMAFFLLLTAITLYFVPSWVAWDRKHHQLAAILALNLLLGWTLLGWAAALVWSLTAIPAGYVPPPAASPVDGRAKCPVCRSPIGPTQRLCQCCRSPVNGSA
jgi:hypothetical protein